MLEKHLAVTAALEEKVMISQYQLFKQSQTDVFQVPRIFSDQCFRELFYC